MEQNQPLDMEEKDFEDPRSANLLAKKKQFPAFLNQKH